MVLIAVTNVLTASVHTLGLICTGDVVLFPILEVRRGSVWTGSILIPKWSWSRVIGMLDPDRRQRASCPTCPAMSSTSWRRRKDDSGITFAEQHRCNSSITMQADDRLAACWRLGDCKSCTHSDHSCGWCPSSSTCVPANHLLEPISNPNVCPLASERFELRTRALGCGCSTITLLSIFVTVFATIVGLFVLYGLGIVLKYLNQHYGTGLWQGWEVDLKDSGSRDEHEWRRRGLWSRSVASLSRRLGWQGDRSEQEQITERSRLLE